MELAVVRLAMVLRNGPMTARSPAPDHLYGTARHDGGHELWALRYRQLSRTEQRLRERWHDNTNTGAPSCTDSPALPTGLSMDSSTCTISGTPSVVTSNTTYTVTADIGGTVYQATIWLSSAYHQLTPSVEGADLTVGKAMDNITFQYDSSAASGSGSGSSSSSSFAYANDKVSAGAHHTCAILDNGDLKCWGFDNWGQLGDGGSNTDTNAPSSTAIDLGTGRTAVAVSAGRTTPAPSLTTAT